MPQVNFEDQSEIVVSDNRLLIYDPYGNACGVTFESTVEIDTLVNALINMKEGFCG
jgi:hypothetical protein